MTPDQPTDAEAAPRRAWTMELKLGADTEDELVNALEQIALEFHMGGMRSGGASGGPASGWSWQTRNDPTMTHERYFQEIERWRTKN